MTDLLDLGINLQALGIGWGTVVMFGLLIALLLTGMPLAFVTLLVALIFALGWFGPMSIPGSRSRSDVVDIVAFGSRPRRQRTRPPLRGR